MKSTFCFTAGCNLLLCKKFWWMEKQKPKKSVREPAFVRSSRPSYISPSLPAQLYTDFQETWQANIHKVRTSDGILKLVLTKGMSPFMTPNLTDVLPERCILLGLGYRLFRDTWVKTNKCTSKNAFKIRLIFLKIWKDVTQEIWFWFFFPQM